MKTLTVVLFLTTTSTLYAQDLRIYLDAPDDSVSTEVWSLLQGSIITRDDMSVSSRDSANFILVFNARKFSYNGEVVCYIVAASALYPYREAPMDYFIGSSLVIDRNEAVTAAKTLIWAIETWNNRMAMAHPMIRSGM